MDEFALIQKTSEIADMNKEFYKEVNKFVEGISKVYDNLEKTRESFKDLQSTRLDKINLRYKDLKESIDKSSDSPLDPIIDKTEIAIAKEEEMFSFTLLSIIKISAFT